MIVRVSTGEYDDSREYTAWELAGDGWWAEAQYSVITVGGRVRYEVAEVGRGSLVRLGRVDVSSGLRAIYRYVDPDTRMRLVRA